VFSFLKVLICAVIAMAVARPGDESHSEVLKRSDDVRADGFDTDVETDNHIKETRSGDEHGNIHGGFSWLSPEGEEIKISYVADENGYQPSGEVLPTPPPVPVEIQHALEWLAAHPHVEDSHH
ncbi:hypothetical protein KR222_002694, partial [Zaprionus bogoriensis]